MRNTTDKYMKIEGQKEETQENEIRITSQGNNSRYVSYAGRLFIEKKHKKIILKASGPAISKACIVAEVLRRRIKSLYQVSKINFINIKDVYVPKEEGLDQVEVERKMTVFEIILTTDKTEIDENAPGFQEPLADDQVVEFPVKFSIGSGPRPRGGRGQRRGGRGGNFRRGGRSFRGGRGKRSYNDDRYNNDDEGYGQRRRGGYQRGGRNMPRRYSDEEEDDYHRTRKGSDSRRGYNRGGRGQRRGGRRGGNFRRGGRGQY